MKVVLGVCGGIAAYKAAELARTLQTQGVEVQVVMTRSAQRFVTPLTFQTLTGKPVLTSLWNATAQSEPASNSVHYEIDHIAVAQAADALVVVPATANILTKFAHGIADDFLSTLYLATTAPVIMAPAMNVHMWQHAATQANVKTLAERGTHIVSPEAGYLACGMTGSGRLADIESIASKVLSVLAPRRDLAQETILITAGGTREPLDPVRFFGNRSSGKMGHALCDAAVARGARVILITASAMPDPVGCKVIRIATAEEMLQAVRSLLHEASIVIKAAAVADYRPCTKSPEKLRRSGPLTLELEPTEDIVADVVVRRREGTLVVAFAAETKNLEANARAKLLRKGADAIVANDVSAEHLGFESNSNAGLFLTADDTVCLPESSKRVMADRILDQVVLLRTKTKLLPGSQDFAYSHHEPATFLNS